MRCSIASSFLSSSSVEAAAARAAAGSSPARAVPVPSARSDVVASNAAVAREPPDAERPASLTMGQQERVTRNETRSEIDMTASE